jgi:hypothetical protein
MCNTWYFVYYIEVSKLSVEPWMCLCFFVYAISGIGEGQLQPDRHGQELLQAGASPRYVVILSLPLCRNLKLFAWLESFLKSAVSRKIK